MTIVRQNAPVVKAELCPALRMDFAKTFFGDPQVARGSAESHHAQAGTSCISVHNEESYPE